MASLPGVREGFAEIDGALREQMISELQTKLPFKYGQFYPLLKRHPETGDVQVWIWNDDAGSHIPRASRWRMPVLVPKAWWLNDAAITKILLEMS